MRSIKHILAMVIIAQVLLSCNREPKQQGYIGSVNSDKYHFPECKWAKNIKSENEIWFETADDAKSEKYKPCKSCIEEEKE